ncbi:MAG: hypothetical protein WCE90_07330 [Candidatus Zixiibacteriota bacterium]
MNSRVIVAAILAIVFCAGPALLVAQQHNEWSDITPVKGIWSRLYFDYQQPEPHGPNTVGMFYCINDWVANHEDDGCMKGGIVCDSATDTCEANLYYFMSDGQLYTITIYKTSATIYPQIAGFEGKFSWNPSPNAPGDLLKHTIWEFSFPTKPIVMVQFTGHDPVVPETVWTPGQSSTITNFPSVYPHVVDGLYADYGVIGSVGCSPHGRSFIPDDLLPKDPDIPPLTIILHEGGGVTIIPEGQQAIPTLTEWGLIIFGVVLLGFITWVFLKRRKVIDVRL